MKLSLNKLFVFDLEFKRQLKAESSVKMKEPIFSLLQQDIIVFIRYRKVQFVRLILMLNKII